MQKSNKFTTKKVPKWYKIIFKMQFGLHLSEKIISPMCRNFVQKVLKICQKVHFLIKNDQILSFKLTKILKNK